MYEDLSASDMQKEAARIAMLNTEAQQLHYGLRDIQSNYIAKFLEDGVSNKLADRKAYNMLIDLHRDEVERERELLAQIEAWAIFSAGVVAAGWKSNLETNERMASIYERQ